ncbi:nucleotidyltransferase domain-containing protein [Blastomonas sp.]|uniref:nucleotidyltransferase family protein n=1 Tax=Blastomonas sp. TaxID=1909299 RepID=UPI00260C7F2D|nr:nucleotidyltransferase domain-containing protein [Blastomonas sp.]MDM7956165.1 nucleotidyltransferase domain-containing protein [Blastomonas sp.]
MDKATAIARLKAHEAELRALGVERLSLFGSTARGEEGPQSDIDLAARFAAVAQVGVFQYAKIADRLEEILTVKVDLVAEPARKPRMQIAIDRDRVDVF